MGSGRIGIRTFYRLSLGLPILVPSLAAIAVYGAGVPPVFPFGLLIASLLFGGLPYAAVAIIGLFYIGGRAEADIRRQALRAPLWTMAAYAAVAAVIGVRSGSLGTAVAVWALGAAVIAVFGYGYVFVVFELREAIFGAFRE